MRKSLEKYNGCIVAVKGEYAGYPKKHEQGIIKFDTDKCDFQKCRDNVSVLNGSEFISKVIQPISFVGDKTMRNDVWKNG